jgi:hypothetical protein
MAPAHVHVVPARQRAERFAEGVAGPARVAGVLISTEAPDLVRNVSYDYR